jgi:hypothetical protein
MNERTLASLLANPGALRSIVLSTSTTRAGPVDATDEGFDDEPADPPASGVSMTYAKIGEGCLGISMCAFDPENFGVYKIALHTSTSTEFVEFRQNAMGLRNHEESRLAHFLGRDHDEEDVYKLYANLNDETAARSPDGDNYVFAYRTELPWLLSNFADIKSSFLALDVYRRAYGRRALTDTALEYEFVDRSLHPSPPGKRTILDRSDPIFRLLACLSIASKFENSMCPLVFAKASRALGFLYIQNDIYREELHVLERIGYRVISVKNTVL